MIISYHGTAAVLGIILAAAIFLLARRDHLQIRYASWWLIMAIGILALGLYPNLTDWAASLLGIAYPPVLALVIGIAALLIKMLLMDIEHSRQARDIRRLTQRLAIWEEEKTNVRKE